MKNRFLLLFLLGIATTGYSQDYIPLVIDSFHQVSGYLDTDNIYNEYSNYNAYSYNENDSLLQIRTPFKRFSYSYGIDTKVITEEELNNDNVWNFTKRQIFTYVNEKLDNVLTETYSGGEWNNNLCGKYFRDELGQDTLFVEESWRYSNEWQGWGRVENEFDSLGNITNQQKYRYNFIYQEVLPNDGFSAMYNSNNQLTTRNYLQHKLDYSGFDIAGTTAYRYDSSGLLDSVLHCRYFQDECEVSEIFTYDYSVPGQIEEEKFRLSTDNIWVKFNSAFTYPGPGVYGAEPDSILEYSRKSTTNLDILDYREYHTYEELPNNCIYYHREIYKVSLYNYTDWYKSIDYEAFYKISTPTSITDSDSQNEIVSIYPNPVRAGEMISINFPDEAIESLKILLFNTSGSLVLTTQINEGEKILAPTVEGMYTLLFLKDGELIGVSRQVVAK